MLVYIFYRVITIEKIQYANYSCEAENKLGKSSGHVILFETVVPICPPACDGYNYISGQEPVRTSFPLFFALMQLSTALCWFKKN